MATKQYQSIQHSNPSWRPSTQSECDSASPQPELTSALGAAISATKTISFRYLLTGPLSSATLASSKPPFGAGREKELERTDGLRREEKKTLPLCCCRRMSMYSIQTVLSLSLF